MTQVLDTPRLVALSEDPVRALCLSEDGSLLALADTNRQLALWRGDTKVQSWDLQSEDERFAPIDIVRAIRILPGSRHLAVAIGRELRLLDIESGAGLWSHMQPNSYGFIAVCPQAVDVSPSGAMVASYDDGFVQTWMPDGTPISQWQMTDMPLFVQSFADGSAFFGAGRFKLVKLDLEGKELEHFSVRDRVFGAHYMERSDRVAVRTLEDVELWEFGAMEPYATLHTASGAPTLAGCEKRSEWAFADQTGVWSVSIHGEKRLISLEFGPLVLCLRYSVDGSRLFAGLSDGRVVVWELGEPHSTDAPLVAAPQRNQAAILPNASLSTVLAMRLGAVIGLFAGMAIASPMVQEFVLAPQNLTTTQRVVTNLWLSFCLGSPLLFVGMAIAWLWNRLRHRS